MPPLDNPEFLSYISGCGSGKYLDVNPSVFNIGSDRCRALAQIAREKDHEVSEREFRVK